MHPDLIAAACRLYATSPNLLTPLSGGHYNAVYQFPLEPLSQVEGTGEGSAKSKTVILRIGVEDCPVEQTLGMLDWVNFLANHGAPVAAPLASIHSHLMEGLDYEGKRYVVTSFEKADGILAENIPPSAWTDELFRNIGTAVGKFHRLSRLYRPSDPALIRPQWTASYEIRQATQKLAATTDPARGQLALLIDELKHLPINPMDYGLIHDDLHFANFLILPDGQVTIIDFDDCLYGWFAIDIAMALFDVLVLYNPHDEAESQCFARRFLSNYLVGYRQENNLSANWLTQIPRFLKLKELCIYADLLGHPDIALPDTWVGRFMRNRAERIANDIPYVDIEFSAQ